MTPEGKVVKKVRDYLNSIGFITINIMSANPSGLPDMIAISPEGDHIYFEIKAPGGRVSPVQKIIHQKLKDQGCTVYVVYSLDEVKTVLEEYYKRRKKQNNEVQQL